MSQDPTKNGAASAASLTERLATPIVWIGGVLSAALILVTLALTVYSVFMRYVVSRPPVWIDELIGNLLGALVSLGVAEAYRRGNHISIDLLTEGLSLRNARLRWIWSDICVLAFSVVLGVSTWAAIEFARGFGSYSSGAIEIETWIPQVPMLIGAILMGMFSVARLIGRFAKGAGQ
jgi:TRAP-type C4-dicarboxylate transport system permease small subunit